MCQFSKFLNSTLPILDDKGIEKKNGSFWESTLRLLSNFDQKEDLDLPTDVIVQGFNEQFGKHLTNRALKHYGKSEESSLNLAEARALLLYIGIFFNKKDLKYHLKRIGSFNGKTDLKELDSEEFYQLLQHFRPLKMPESVFGKLSNQYRSSAIEDLKMLNAVIDVDHYKNEEDQEIASSEFLAHELVYHNLRKGMLIPVYDREGRIQVREVTATIDRWRGLVCFFLESVDPVAERTIEVMFRGTVDRRGVVRNLQAHSPGKKSFDENHELLILHTIIRRAFKVSRPSVGEINFYGHSLGSCDAGRAITTFTDYFARNKDKEKWIDNPFPIVKKVQAYLWNAPGVAHTTNEKFLQAEKELNQESETPHPLHEHKVEFNIFHGKVVGDSIQKCGEVGIGYRIDSPFVHRKIYKFDYGFNSPWEVVKRFFSISLKAHKKIHYNKSLKHSPRLRNVTHIKSDQKDLLDKEAAAKTFFAETTWRVWEWFKYNVARLFEWLVIPIGA